EHRRVVLDGLEQVGWRPTHALGGAVGGDEIGEARLELAELAHERVVFGIGDLGPGLDVVQVLVVVDLLAQLGDALRGVGPRHARSISPAACWSSRTDVILPSDRSRFRSAELDMPRSSMLKVAAETRATTASVQDYLAAIYDLTSSGKPVIGARLAKHMGISAPAVTEAIHRMARGGYVKIGRGKELALSNKGQQIAEVM